MNMVSRNFFKLAASFQFCFMKKILAVGICLVLMSFNSTREDFRWGQTGHRTVGHIADGMLSKRAQKNVKRVLGHETLAEVSTWMDEVRSDRDYDYAQTWHYTTIPDGETYETAEKQENGDVIWAIEKIITELKAGNLSAEDEATNLKFLVHLVGDIHQPLHVGNGKDRGGNDEKVQWFGANTNLHSVWDSRMIDGKQFSYTELADKINHASKVKIKEWQAASVRDWAVESMELRTQVYDVPENGRLSYNYSYENFDLVEQRLLQAGIRLADVINEIYK